MKTQPYRGSHLPALIAAVNRTSGPIWEFGSGMYSTPYLHWACNPRKRLLITVELQDKWYDFAKQFANDYHTILTSLDDFGPDSEDAMCSVALVDHDALGNVRGDILPHLHACEVEYVILHDAERPDRYGYTPWLPLFKHQYLCRNSRIRTLVLSNQHRLENFIP